VKFAEFTEGRLPPEPWGGVVVRPLAEADVSAVSEIYAERERVDRERATRAVSPWVDSDPHRRVFVAERHGQVLGYGKAERLRAGDEAGRAPTGWYLTGLVVTPSARRHGVGVSLTLGRLKALAGVTDEVWYFANVRNRATIALHERLGFEFVTNDFHISGVTFNGGHGALYWRHV